MILLLCADKRRSGFTLVELLIAASVTTVLLISLCGIYMSITQEWQRHMGQADALVAISRTFSAISSDLSTAIAAQVVNMPDGRQVLIYRLPGNKIDNIYTPVWSGGRLQFVQGEDKAYYLSNSSGSAQTGGNILWRGCVTWSGGNAIISPDPKWDADAQRGRISPLSSLTFDVNSPRRVTIKAISSYRLTSATGTGSTGQIARNSTVCTRGAN